MTRIAILISGRGSNCLAILQAIRDGRLTNCEAAVVISNIASAPGLEAARALGVEAVALESRGRPQAEHEAAVLALLEKFRIDLVCLAGYMRILTPTFVRQFPARLLNIHPSLLPSFPGLHAQRQALDYGATITGCSVHFVDDTVDGGVLILQRPVEIQPTDTEQSLSARILIEEHKAYIEAIARVLSGTYEIQARRYLPKNPTTPEPTAAH